MKRIAILLLFAVLACAAVGYSLLSSQQGASADPAVVLLDDVNVGDTTSEATHNLVGWSDIWSGCPWCSTDGNMRLIWGNGGETCDPPYKWAEVDLDAGASLAQTLTIHHLDGASDDSYDVYVNTDYIGHYTATPATANTWYTTSFDISAGLYTGVVTIKLEATAPAGTLCPTYGQVAVSWMELYGEEPADLKKESLSLVGISNGQDVPVSEQVWFQLEEVLHNNGPSPLVPAWSITWATPPPGGLVSYHCEGGEIVTINDVVVQDSCPYSHVEVVGYPDVLDVHINVDLPISTPEYLYTDWDIHCLEASTHTWHFENVVEAKDPLVNDPEPGNNFKALDLTVDCIGTANPKIVSQQINAPSQVAVSVDVPVTVSKVLHNNGPYGPVEVEVGAVIDSVNIGYDSPACPSPYSPEETAHAAYGWGEDVATACTGGNYGGGSDDGDSRLAWYLNELPSSANDTREASVTLTNPGFQLGILRTNVLDGSAASNSFELQVNDIPVYTYHSNPSTAEFWVVHSIDLVNPGSSSFDGSSTQCVGDPVTNAPCFIAGTGIDPFTDSLEIEFTVLGDKWSGFDTWGQLAVSWVQLIAGGTYQEVLPLPVSTDVMLDENLVIHCSEASTHTFEFVNTILRIKDEHVVDSDLGNNTMPGAITVDCIGTANPKIVSQQINAPSQVAVSQDVPVTVSKVLHNNGPYGPVEVEVGAVIDSVNIGYDSPACPSPYSPEETAHAAYGWGEDVATACTGGNYGGGSDDGDSRLAWYLNELPSSANDTREASVTLTNPGFQLGILRTNVLDGSAASNSFELQVNDIPVYTYHSNPSTAEFWVVHSIDLVNPGSSSFDGSSTQCVGDPVTNAPCFIAGTGIDPFTDSLEIEFTVLGDKWSGFDTWGQLAVSWVQLIAGGTYQEVLPLPVSTEVVVEEHLVIHCSEASTHVFPFENTILRIKDEHVVDSDLGNNTMAGQITVDCIGTANPKIVSQQINAPSQVAVSENVPVTVSKVLHNNGPYGPVEVEVGAVIDSVNIGYDSPACPSPYSADENDHAADGWGEDVATACTGGNYGGGSDDGDSRLAWYLNELPSSANDTREASVTLTNPGFQLGILRTNVLDGQAGSNSFELRVNDTLVYTYHSDPSTAEFWVVHSIDLVNPVNSTVDVGNGTITAGTGIDPFTDSLEIEFTVLGDKWSGFDTYGQLAVSWVQLLAGDTYQEVLPLPVSTEVVVQEDLVIHCFEPSTHTFEFVNTILRIKDEHVVDSDLGNNTMPGQITVDCLADVEVEVSQEFLDWPENINVSEQVPVTLRKTITADVVGPATTAEIPKVFVDVNKSASAPDGCTVDPTGAEHLQVEVLTTEPTVLDEVFYIHCIPSGPRTFTFTNEVSEPKDPHISDPTPTNVAVTQEAVTAWAEVDVQVSQQFTDWPLEIDVSVSEMVTLRKTITATVVGPATENDIPRVFVDVNKTASAPAGCTVDPTGAEHLQVEVLTTEPTVLTEVFTIHCSEPSTHGPFIFDNVVSGPKDPHISDPAGGNNAAHTERTVDAIGYSDLKVTAQYMADPPAQIPMSQDVVVTLDKVIHNNGTWGPVDAKTTTTVTVPTNCTVRPEVHVQQFHDVPVSVDVLHHEPFVIHCNELGPYTFTFDDTVAVKSPHVVDTDLTNNDWNGTELTVEAMALADIKITGASWIDPPTKIPLGADEDVTLQKHIHNNGPWGPVDIAIDSDATAPTGCTVAPKSVPASISGVPVSVDQVVDEVWTINCIENTTLKTFVFDNSISVTTAHVYDPDEANNASKKYLTVSDDPADPQGDMDGDGWTNGAEAVIGTDPADACPDDPSDDAWPPDINNDASVNILDVLRFKGPISGAYDSRYDLNADSAVNILDVLRYKPLIGIACTP